MKNIKIISCMALILFISVFLGCVEKEPKLSQQRDDMTEQGMESEHGSQKINSIDRNAAGLVNSEPSQIIELPDGGVFQLEAKPVVKNINGNIIRMLAYNGQIPGPLMKVKQGSSMYVNFTNKLDMETTVHWHGIRLENKYDGVADVTQNAVKAGESFLYKLDFPDDGIYWYHPHVRDDIGQELGLYGNILVEPTKNYSPVDKEVALFLDDIKIEKGDVDLFSKNFARFALTGRFGNIMLVNGETNYTLNVKKGEAVRFYLTNSANTRTFNSSIEGEKMKLVGGDSGRYEKETFVDHVTLGIAERYIVEVLFEKSGTFAILHTTPEKNYAIGKIIVSEDASESKKSSNFYMLKNNDDIVREIAPFKKYITAKPDNELQLTIDMSMMDRSGMMDSGMMGSNTMDENQPVEPIEWEEDAEMAMMNSMSTSENVKWVIKDKATGKEKPRFKVKVGDAKKISLFNHPDSMHPMQHPIHLHGQRFLVLTQDGKNSDNLVWKDTVLVPAGRTIDILVEFSNPGEWLIHCHIPEHAEAGMIASFTVVR
ncbi:MAG: multicopper oxidase family protein [Candidatus Methanoperedens sp.]|nr:multicopper oxidase family protein [Candidatus Methanoperedens sp.]